MKVQYTSGWDSGYNGGTPAQSRPMSASSQRYMKKLTTLQSSSASSANQDGEVDDSGKETNAIVRVTSSPSPSMPFKIGERVYAAVQGSMCLGTVRYIGSLVTDNKNYSNNKKQQLATGDHISGLLWVGVRLERPIGYHDGIFKGKRFFQTEPNRK